NTILLPHLENRNRLGPDAPRRRRGISRRCRFRESIRDPRLSGMHLGDERVGGGTWLNAALHAVPLGGLAVDGGPGARERLANRTVGELQNPGRGPRRGRRLCRKRLGKLQHEPGFARRGIRIAHEFILTRRRLKARIVDLVSHHAPPYARAIQGYRSGPARAVAWRSGGYGW